MSSLLASTDFAGRSNSCRDSRPTPHLSSPFRDFLPITCLFWKFGKASLDSEQTPSQSHNTSLMINRSMSGSVLQCSHPHWSAPLATRTTATFMLKSRPLWDHNALDQRHVKQDGRQLRRGLDLSQNYGDFGPIPCFTPLAQWWILVFLAPH